MTREIGWKWKSTGWVVEPSTARELMAILGSIGVYRAGQQFAWRGMSSIDYDLTSSIHREFQDASEEEIRREEISLISDARGWGLGAQPTGHVDDMQVLADLQHYGVPTRLLDFTSNPMTALWFACQKPTSGSVAMSGVLLALNITEFMRYATVAAPGPGTWGGLSDPLSGRLAMALNSSKPFVLESSNPNDRLRAQEGFFVSGATPASRKVLMESGVSIEWVTPFQSIDVQYKSGDSMDLSSRLRSERGQGAPDSLPFVAVMVKAGLKSKLLRYLGSTYNRSARVLFPDYSGFREFRSGQ